MQATQEAAAAHADWQGNAVRLKHQGKDTNAIALLVNKSEATVRRAIAKAREGGHVFPGDPADVAGDAIDHGDVASNGNGNGHVDADTAHRLATAAGLDVPAGDDPDPDYEVIDAEVFEDDEVRDTLFDTAWMHIVGGEQPSESKIRIVGGAISPVNLPDGGVKSGGRYRIEVDVLATGYGADGTVDKASGEIASVAETRKLKITGARFL